MNPASPGRATGGWQLATGEGEGRREKGESELPFARRPSPSPFPVALPLRPSPFALPLRQSPVASCPSPVNQTVNAARPLRGDDGPACRPPRPPGVARRAHAPDGGLQREG